MTKLYDLSRLRIMVIDDNRHMQTIIRSILQGFGINVIETYSDSRAAYIAIHDVAPDLLLIDWEMPLFSGVEFIRMLRRDPCSPNTFLPVIIISAYGDRAHVVEARDAGANEFLVKPVSAQAVYARLIAIVEHPRPFVRSRNYVGPCRRRHKDASYKGPERRSTGGKSLAQSEIDELLSREDVKG